MKKDDAVNQYRRGLVLGSVATAAAAAFSSLPLIGRAADAPAGGLKIGIIGSGRIGGTVGELWVKAGHEVMFSSQHIEHDQELAASLGPKAHAGTPAQAAAYGAVVLIAVPYGALPQLGREVGDAIKGKVVLDTCNPVVARDGDVAVEAKEQGTGIVSPRYLPGARLVRAFNTVGYARLKSEAGRSGDKIAIPLAGDDAAAVQVAVRLVNDAGFEPVIVGPLARAKEFDAGTAVYGKALTAKELRQGLGLTT